METRQFGKTDMQVSVLGSAAPRSASRRRRRETVADLLTAPSMPGST